MRRFSPGLLFALLFVLIGLPFLRKAGIHFDAAYELACFYGCSNPAFRPVLFGSREPIMIIQYLGAFKAWLYRPILLYLETTPLILRLPTLLLGAGSVWAFFAVLDRTVGRRVAIAGAALLATDASFVIATGYDFGPVALLHFFLLAGLLLLLRFERTRASKYLALAFFLFGLALWHKALFIWMLAGLGAAALAVFPKRVLAPLSPGRVAIAALALCLGAAPLLYYNAVTGGSTLHTGSVMSQAAPFSQKVVVLNRTLDGSIFFGWLTDESSAAPALPVMHMTGRIAAALNHATGDISHNLMFCAFLVSLCLLPWLWFTPSRRPALFAAIYGAVTWAMMLALPNTGATLHHVILLWPIPQFLVAVALVEIARRWMRAAALGFVVLLAYNLLVLDSIYVHLLTKGTTTIWTDAIYALADYAASMPAADFVTVDWGYSQPLCLLSDGQIRMTDISYALLDAGQRDAGVRALIANPLSVFVDHAPEAQESFIPAQQRLARIAARMGYVRELMAVIKDRNQRPRFVAYRYVRAGS